MHWINNFCDFNGSRNWLGLVFAGALACFGIAPANGQSCSSCQSVKVTYIAGYYGYTLDSDDDSTPGDGEYPDNPPPATVQVNISGGDGNQLQADIIQPGIGFVIPDDNNNSLAPGTPFPAGVSEVGTVTLTACQSYSFEVIGSGGGDVNDGAEAAGNMPSP